MGNNFSEPNAGSRYSSAPPQGTAEWYRAEANRLYTERNQAFVDSKAAYRTGSGARAKQLSNKGKALARQAEAMDKRASELIFEEKNHGRSSTEVDLHGLKVSEALERARTAIQSAKAEGRPELVLIVGRGLHSEDGVAKLKPAVKSMIDSLINTHNLQCIPNRPNQGCITVRFVSRAERGWVWKLLETVCVIC